MSFARNNFLRALRGRHNLGILEFIFLSLFVSGRYLGSLLHLDFGSRILSREIANSRLGCLMEDLYVSG